MVFKRNKETYLFLSSTYDPLAFRDIQVGLYKTVVSGTYGGLALNEKHGLHLRH